MAIKPSKDVSAAPAKARPAIGRFGRDDRGATAVEFGLIALPFFALLFAIIETALVFFAGQALETAVANSARLIRTGQAQQLNFSASDFKNDICGQVMALFNCADKLVVDVQTFDSFGSISLAPPLDADGNLDTTSKYLPGSGGQIVVVRAYYEWPVIVQMLGLDLTNMANGTHLMSAAAAFRNEPFPW